MTSTYSILKYVHVTCVTLSGVGFLLRGSLMLVRSPRLETRLFRVAPHVIDTLLLSSALSLAFLSHQYPFVHAWLTAKVLGLLAYILCGTMALKRAHTQGLRITFLLLALACFAYIVSVALTRNPWGFFSFFA